MPRCTRSQSRSRSKTRKVRPPALSLAISVDSGPLRSHHCKFCNRCVATYDHHCVCIGTCIGRRIIVGFGGSSCFRTVSFGIRPGRQPATQRSAVVGLVRWCKRHRANDKLHSLVHVHICLSIVVFPHGLPSRLVPVTSAVRTRVDVPPGTRDTDLPFSNGIITNIRGFCCADGRWIPTSLATSGCHSCGNLRGKSTAKVKMSSKTPGRTNTVLLMAREKKHEEECV